MLGLHLLYLLEYLPEREIGVPVELDMNGLLHPRFLAWAKTF
jgi:hypothetical protein